MRKLKDHTVEHYLNALSSREPIPGGGSASALTGALGVALISMVTQYSLNKGKPPSIEKALKKILIKSEKIRKELIDLVDRDAQAYLKVVKTKKAAPHIKKAAEAYAAKVPREICVLCYEAVNLTPLLVTEGNKYLISDLEAAVEMLLAAYSAAEKFCSENNS